MKKCADAGETRKVTDVHPINNSAADRILAKVGGFARWTLEIKEGVDGLLDGG
jgi:hypothetical protein